MSKSHQLPLVFEAFSPLTARKDKIQPQNNHADQACVERNGPRENELTAWPMSPFFLFFSSANITSVSWRSIFIYLFLISLRHSRWGRAEGDSFAATELYCPLRSTATSFIGLILVARKTDPQQDLSPSSSSPLDSRREFRTESLDS